MGRRLDDRPRGPTTGEEAAVTEVVAFVDGGLGNSSYLVDVGDGRALAVDPSRDSRPYLAAAEKRGLTISHTVETHLHADFVTGSRELAAHGAAVLASTAAAIEWPHRGVGHGDEVDLGGLTLRALATPGHTPEHLAFLLLDAERPIGLFSGGSLLVGSVARTDLIDPDETEGLARALWRSINEQLLLLPDDLVVYPTHGAGSFCSAPAGGERTTTIGRERTTNPLLAAGSEDAFVARLLGGLGTYPPYFLELREVNRRGPHVYAGFPDLAQLDGSEVCRLVDAGAAVVDVRSFGRFGAGHIPGSLSIELRPQFASWLGWLVGRDRPVVFVTDADTDRRELVRQCLTVGYEHLAGELDGGMGAWTGPIGHVGLVPVGQVVGPVLDIRQDAEYEAGHLPGAAHVELGALTDTESRVESGPMTVMCGHGERAMTAASLLAAGGRPHLAVAVGGPTDWATVTGRTLATGR
jgi:glyoxylase-like metal-dependent hydrolase (beta-lactamase superfamily II)/rhodanese-related sulfurtransferase